MKRWKRLIALCLALLLLSGCGSLLEREYISLQPHDENPMRDGEDAALQVESYQELVNAILYYVGRGETAGEIHLYHYDQGVESDLEAACLEVVREDPLGAYAVDYIKYETRHIVSYYQATLYITYRRTPEQIAGISSVTGSSAIREELRETMEAFQSERVLNISFFDADAVDLEQLIREAYYAAPAAAFGMPQVEVNLYPEETAGRRRVVEVLLTYPEEQAALREKRDALEERTLAMGRLLRGLSGETAARTVFAMVRENAAYLPDQPEKRTAYDALFSGGADSEGMALLTKLLCDTAGVECSVVQGRRRGKEHFWVTLDWGDGPVQVDASAEDGFGLSRETLAERGYESAGTDG